MDTPPPLPPARIVAIGASAGGLEAIEQLFALVPPDTGMAFVVIQHLSPDFRSLMDTLIQRHTQMAVEMARDGIAICPDHIYVLPPGKQMIVRSRRIVLTDRPPNAFQLPIDTFLRALAQDVGPEAVAIILSGTGTDGSRGIVDVKDGGGVVLVETPNTAKFDGMPRAAIATGVADAVRTARELGILLGSMPPVDTELPELTAVDLTPTEAILALLHERYGIDFALYRTSTVARRILRRIGLSRVPSIADYVEQLRATPGDLDILYRDLLIGVTQFFRDPEAWEALEREIIPRILDAVPPEDEVRVWVAACATGEEAYTVAMLFLDAFEQRGRTSRLRVIATDAHERSIAVASAGLYSADQLSQVTDVRLDRYFAVQGPSYTIAPILRQSVMFVRHDLTRDPPFTKVQLITCRNMLIYLQPSTQKTILSLFHFGLAPDGFLMLGASETASSLGDELETIDARWRLFQKRREVPIVRSVQLEPGTVAVAPPSDDRSSTQLLNIYDELLDMFMPPGFLVDENRALVDSFGGAERLLHTPARRPSANLLELIDDELRIVLGGALQRVFERGAPISYTNVAIDLDGPARGTVTVRRVPSARRGPRHAIITLTGTERAITPETSTIEQHELADARQQLDFATSQLATSDDALQGANEELRSANEELQSANEELQSVNEELFTVNAEHQRQIAELRELHADVQHLLEGSDVGTLFLDKTLRIRRFTSRMAAIFRFQPGDSGRSIVDFAHTLQRPSLVEDLASVNHNGPAITAEVHDDAKTLYLLRIVRAEDGVILMLTDISALDRARAR